MAFILPKTLNSIFNTPFTPSLGPERRADILPIDILNNELETAIPQSGFNGENAHLVRSAALLWHDHLYESHKVSQGIKSMDGSFVHGIMHRREPDYSNAKYWFNRVGSHPVFPEISNRAKNILTGSSLAHLAEGDWDSFAMVDAVAAASDGSEEYSLLQQVQQMEFEVLLEQFCG
jgi:hypothetical protein